MGALSEGLLPASVPRVRTRVSSARFPDEPGAYVVYDGEQVLYVGVAATQTLKQRWQQQHLKPRAGGSALRRTLGVHLGLVKSKVRRAEGRYYPPDIEQAITRFLRGCDVDLTPTVDAATARALERQLIGTLTPVLNVHHQATAEARAKRALGQALSSLDPNLDVDERGYVRDLGDNLLPGISSADIEDEFAAGAGDELKGKMLAPWSSAVLAVNSFARWRNSPETLELAGLSAFLAPFSFEAACRHGVRGTRPHLDVLLTSANRVVGVESKCLEYLRPHAQAKVADAYKALADNDDPRATSCWFAALEHVPSFRRLDAYQLVKHYLGLSYSYPQLQRTLVYLYWEPVNPDERAFAEHRAEISRFQELVGCDQHCSFVALSYAEHWRELDALATQPLWLQEHLRLLRARYVVRI